MNGTQIMARRHVEHGDNLEGTMQKASRPKCDLSIQIQNAVDTVNALSKKEGISIDDVVTRVLYNSRSELNSYVISQKEVPELDLHALVLQTALLRMADICSIASALNTSDYDGKMSLENEENNIIANYQNPDTTILLPGTQACIDLVIERLCQNNIKAGGTGRYFEVLNTVRTAGSYFVGNGFVSSIWDNAGETGMDSLEYDTTGYPSGTVDTAIPTPITDSSQTPSATPPDTVKKGGILTFIDNVTDSIGKAIDTAGAAGGLIDKAKDAVTGLGSDIGKQSIEKYLKDNWWKIALFILGLVIIIIIIVKLAGNKHK
jgi:hypothetical protein